MGIKGHGSDSFFKCEVCSAYFVGEGGSTWDEARLAAVQAKEAGWHLFKRRGGRWEALCPDCATASDPDVASLYRKR
jgi:hypothetical protein